MKSNEKIKEEVLKEINIPIEDNPLELQDVLNELRTHLETEFKFNYYSQEFVEKLIRTIYKKEIKSTRETINLTIQKTKQEIFKEIDDIQLEISKGFNAGIVNTALFEFTQKLKGEKVLSNKTAV